MQSGEFIYERMKVMEVQMTKECEIFNCDKKRGNYCCYYCEKQCDNRCINNPEKCGQYMKSQKWDGWYTKILDHGKINVCHPKISDCMRKLAEYEATGLQPQEVQVLQKRYRSDKL